MRVTIHPVCITTYGIGPLWDRTVYQSRPHRPVSQHGTTNRHVYDAKPGQHALHLAANPKCCSPEGIYPSSRACPCHLADTLRVLEYAGQGAAVKGGAPVSALDLAAADIVLTTYDILRRDVHHQPDLEVPTCGLRRRKKYEAGNSGPFLAG